MRILQLIYESENNPYGFGGAGVRAYEIYRRLADRHDITLLCMRYPGAKDGIYRGLRHLFVGTESYSLIRSVLSYTIRTTHHLFRHARGYDVVVENFLPSTPFLTRAVWRGPVVLQIQGIMGRHLFRKFPMRYALPMFLVERIYPYLYRDYIFVTEVGMERFKKRARRYACIPNGVDEALLEGEPQEDNYLLFLSRIDMYTKGLDLLLDAFVNLAKRFDGLKLYLAGYQFTPIEELLRRVPEGLRDRVEYLGFLTAEEKKRVLQGAKVFVLPSRHEAHPVSLLEAMASGKATLVSDIPELGFVKDRGAGLTFRPEDPKDLQRKLQTLLSNASLRHSLGQRGRQYARAFIWDRIAREFEGFLKTCTS